MTKTPNFSGTWESVSVEGLDDFLTVLKVNIIKCLPSHLHSLTVSRRKMASLATPTHAIEHEGDRFLCTIDMGPMTKVEDMIIGGGEVDSETPLGDKCLATLEWCAATASGVLTCAGTEQYW